MHALLRQTGTTLWKSWVTVMRIRDPDAVAGVGKTYLSSLYGSWTIVDAFRRQTYLDHSPDASRLESTLPIRLSTGRSFDGLRRAFAARCSNYGADNETRFFGSRKACRAIGTECFFE